MRKRVFSSLIVMLALLSWPGGTVLRAEVESVDQVWQVGERRWDEAEERRFAAWVEGTVTEDFFLQARIAVDCADVPYAIRWVYARLAGLPAAATLGDGRLFGHWSTAWAHLPTHPDWHQDRRFLAALNQVLSESTTSNLPADTYPIRIGPDSLLAGTVTVVPAGHAGLVGRIVLDGSHFSPVQTWEATLPRKVRKLRQRSYFSTWPDAASGTGLVRFRWPVTHGGRWGYLARQGQPSYSLEQYQPDFARWGELFDEAVARRIDPTPYEPSHKAMLILNAIRRYLEERVALVQEGYRHCRGGSCPEGSGLWEVYSTPSRDGMITFEIEHLVKLIRDSGMEDAFMKIMDRMPLAIDANQTVTVGYVVRNYRWLSSEPGVAIPARWGLAKCDMIRARMRVGLQDLDFVEQRYRESDAQFADSSRRSHLRELRWLQEEGRGGRCADLPILPAEGE